MLQPARCTDGIECSIVQELLNSCAQGCYTPPPPPPRKPPPPKKGCNPATQWCGSPPLPILGYWPGILLITYECAACEDGTVPTLESGCDCSVESGCGCGLQYCACQYEKCLTAKEHNSVLPGFPGIGGIIECENVWIHDCPPGPPCAVVKTEVRTKTVCGPCRDGSTPSPPECRCPEIMCGEMETPPPCLPGQCLDLSNGCCAACGPIIVIPQPQSGGPPPAFMLPSSLAESDFLAATAAIGV